VQSALDVGSYDREEIRDRISEGGVLTADVAVLHAAARDMLKSVLSCRINISDSGVSSRIAGGEPRRSHAPSKHGNRGIPLLPLAAGTGAQRSRRGGDGRGAREGDTRAALVKHCTGTTWHFPGALFPLTEEERVNAARQSHWVSGNVDGTEQADEPGDNVKAPEEGDNEGYDQSGSDAPDGDPQHFATAAE
jgi:ParB family chromosome partitioning protein